VKRLVLAALAAGAALVVPAPMAHAGDAGYAGTCRFSTLNDVTPGGQLGGNNSWNGQVNVAVVATNGGDPAVPTGDPISVDCELRINGISQGVVLHAEGPGVAAGADDLTYTSVEGDVVSMCTNVTITHADHTHESSVCVDATRTQIVPQPVIDAINLVLDFIADNTIVVDMIVCPILAGLPDVPGVLEWDDGGDTYLLGELFLDCYPYAT
jgi:hypothetical protein